MSRFALHGARTGELLTYGGAVITHTNRAELEWLFPKTRVVRITSGDLGRPTLPLPEHPDIKALKITFPLRREQFRA